MKLSEISRDKLSELTDEQVCKIIFGGVRDGGESADVALLLGSRPENCADRAEKAAELYLEGRVKYIIPSGGVEWEYEGKKISEAHFMADILVRKGVPQEAIILENEALTTKENMIYGVLQMNRVLKIQNVRRVCIVSSAAHICRSLALAKLFLPRTVTFFGCPSCPPEAIDKESEQVLSSARRELSLLKGLVDNRLIDDIESAVPIAKRGSPAGSGSPDRRMSMIV